MVSRVHAGSVAVLIAVLGCATSAPSRPGAFSDEWRAECERHQRKTPSKQGEITILGKDKGARAYIYTDDKGRPRLAVGGSGRISADIDIRHGEPAVEFKYKLKFGRKPLPLPRDVYEDSGSGDEASNRHQQQIPPGSAESGNPRRKEGEQ